ncbi:MAG: ABC transporter permease [Candidatus Nomurabacteria bacterium]|jgi:putative ABC transport system permease protein|nr:ABC transporter permease [Candidatus Nomurabacteria bacterium]
MNFASNIAQTLQNLKANKTRSFLTMLGIIIGISSVIAIVTVGDSLSVSINNSMQELGASNITVSLQSKTSSRSGLERTYAAKDLLTKVMIEDLRQTYPSQIDDVSLTLAVGNGQTTKGKQYANLTLTGVNPSYGEVNDITLKSGRFLSDRDDLEQRRACVVSDKLAERIFGSASPLAERITMALEKGAETCTIVGVYEYQASLFAAAGVSDDDIVTTVYIPLETASKITNQDGFSTFTIVTAIGVNSTDFANQVGSFFGKYYSRNDDYEVTASSMESMVETVQDMINNVSMAVAVVAAISLVVGGIGVMNIMIVSITERTREIGTRKAVGATNADIRWQFIIEAVVICLIGGIFGVLLGVAGGITGAILLGFTPYVSAAAIAAATLFSMFVGVFFGYYPANKAAKMNPIDALRYE